MEEGRTGGGEGEKCRNVDEWRSGEVEYGNGGEEWRN